VDRVIISTQLPDQFNKLESLLSEKVQLINFPMIEIEYIPLDSEINEKINKVSKYTWLIFTSMRGVRGFFELQRQSGNVSAYFEFPKIACIGNATGLELIMNGYQPDYVNPGNTSREFSISLLNDVLKPEDKVLLVLGERADDYLQAELQRHCFTERINVYKTIDVEQVDIRIFEMIEHDQYHLILFTSPSAFQNFVKLGNYHPGGIEFKILSIGNRTTSEIEKLGYRVLITAQKSSMDGLADEIMKFFNKM
jgi:uroporphyrinogen III methyltransferase/synthase